MLNEFSYSIRSIRMPDSIISECIVFYSSEEYYYGFQWESEENPNKTSKNIQKGTNK